MASSVSDARRGWFLHNRWYHCYNINLVYPDMEQRQIRKLRPNTRISGCSDGIDVCINLLYSDEDLLHSYVYLSGSRARFAALSSLLCMCGNI